MQSYAIPALASSVLHVSPSGWSSMFPPPPKWSAEEMPDLSGKVVVVTGGNDGIGKETVKALLAHNAKVYMASRNQIKAQVAIDELKRETGREAIFLRLDLASLQSVKAAAQEFLGKETGLHVLINNAGSIYPPVEDVTEEGYDLQFGTNVLGHYYFTKLLIPVLLKTARVSADGKARIVHVASVGHEFVNGIDFETLKDGPKRRRWHTTKLYFQSKFGNVVVANEFHRRYADQGLVSFSLHPGNLKFDTKRHPSWPIKLLGILNPLIPGPKMGALTQLWAGTMPEGGNFGGKYCIPYARVGQAKKETDDPELGRMLWEWLEEQVRDVEPPYTET
ncbi:NAD-P-binding protein [Fomitopsis serialis]|uniref:NAD-P-binding protein n=1 Tax=Fomitopsis serialis TaxID=139415 RepID=UPI0020081BF5|nr:NAD-P-binding protein [Neoantrodia serialis]KAH9919685.1 NAD-P-binding protein [Neoantrodia serialis]